MLKFSNIGILWKVLTLVGLISAVTIGGAFYATHQMRYIDNSYGDLLDGPGRANLAIARANRNLVYIDRSIYRLLSEPSADKKKDAAQEAFDSVGFFQKQIKAASRALPDEASHINEFGKRLDDIIAGDCAAVLKFGVSTDPKDEKAAIDGMRDACDPALNKAMVDISALTNKLLKTSDDASDRVLEVTNSTIRSTLFFNFGALGALLALAGFAARSGIARPIREVAETLERLAHGDMSTEIPGAGRADEVGVMARAAVHFRDRNRETLQMRQRAAEIAEAELDRVAKDREEGARRARIVRTAEISRAGAPAACGRRPDDAARRPVRWRLR